MSQPITASLSGIGSEVPQTIITNHDLEKLVDTNDEWIRTRTGIHERRQASDDQAASDLATAAAVKALAVAGLSAEDLGAIIVATSTPDMIFPSTACVVQKNLQAVNAFAYDLSAACAGFLFALSNGSQYVETGICRHVLVIGSDLMSRITDSQDRNTCVLFGDGAGAVILSASAHTKGLMGTQLGSDGRFGDILQVPAGGSRMPLTAENFPDRKHYIHMNGSEVFKMAVRGMEQAALKLLDQTETPLHKIDWLVPHQANKRIIETLGKRLNMPPEKVFMNLQHYGNMSAASIPVALDEAWQRGFINPQQLVLMLAFGGGLTWGASLLQWSLPSQA
ncbi:MAG: beta-ketoacyl-ACP synthase III [Bacillota bacterium]|nr:beta-ketoacyl-ACP synthase III [Bacillota bacterium]MDW7676250.1 beta-ketoacyl-ACP synthase III [Bacillota bacterium]